MNCRRDVSIKVTVPFTKLKACLRFLLPPMQCLSCGVSSIQSDAKHHRRPLPPQLPRPFPPPPPPSSPPPSSALYLSSPQHPSQTPPSSAPHLTPTSPLPRACSRLPPTILPREVSRMRLPLQTLGALSCILRIISRSGAFSALAAAASEKRVGVAGRSGSYLSKALWAGADEDVETEGGSGAMGYASDRYKQATGAGNR